MAARKQSSSRKKGKAERSAKKVTPEAEDEEEEEEEKEEKEKEGKEGKEGKRRPAAEAGDSEDSGTKSSETYVQADATRLYLKEIGFSPLLTAEEEVFFARKAQRGDAAGRRRLIENNFYL